MWAGFQTKQVRSCLTFFFSLSFCLSLTVVQQLMWLTETLGWPWMAHVSPSQKAASEPGLVEVRPSLPLAPGLTWLHSSAAAGPGGPYCMIVVPHTHTHTSVNHYFNCLVVSLHTRSSETVFDVRLVDKITVNSQHYFFPFVFAWFFSPLYFKDDEQHREISCLPLCSCMGGW